jgi:hypothetical protein
MENCGKNVLSKLHKVKEVILYIRVFPKVSRLPTQSEN